jgi:hypothetical protein
MGSLVLAGGCFAAALAFSAGGWCALLPRGPRAADACARFGCGSLANTFLPAHAGDVVRLNLFGRVVPGGMLAAAGAAAVFSAARWLALLPLAGSTLPPEALVVPAVGLAVAVALARRRRATRWMYAKCVAFAAASLAARVGGVALVTGSISAALLVVPALELAGVVSVTPANLGVADAAAALALHAHGLPMGRAMTTALVLHGVETAASVVFGGAGLALLIRRTPFLHHIVTIRPTTLWTTARTGPDDAPEDRAAALRAPRAHTVERRRIDGFPSSSTCTDATASTSSA